MPNYVSIAQTIARRAPSSSRDLIDICDSLVAQYRASHVNNERHASLVNALLRDKHIVALVRV
jgi:hypothetical protein